ncbi:unnamed protein product [Dovyalis caffra]|uniref:Uncharacterized protein n=1 Tax=Dovyalis caffra TaxID=77055 RepID=A0AAV1R623_9ROSI|nr:unnamed protein product [Dovyalis caffra]
MDDTNLAATPPSVSLCKSSQILRHYVSRVTCGNSVRKTKLTSRTGWCHALGGFNPLDEQLKYSEAGFSGSTIVVMALVSATPQEVAKRDVLGRD